MYVHMYIYRERERDVCRPRAPPMPSPAATAARARSGGDAAGRKAAGDGSADLGTQGSFSDVPKPEAFASMSAKPETYGFAQNICEHVY